MSDCLPSKHILYQQNCTVELLIRIPPLSYALMGGPISLLICGCG